MTGLLGPFRFTRKLTLHRTLVCERQTGCYECINENPLMQETEIQQQPQKQQVLSDPILLGLFLDYSFSERISKRRGVCVCV